MPVGVDGLYRAGAIELGDLLGGQVPAGRIEVLSQLLLVARTHDHGRNRWPLQEPVERNLRDGLPGFFRYLIQSIDHPVEIFIGHLRAHIAGFVQAAYLRQRLSAANLAGKSSPA